MKKVKYGGPRDSITVLGFGEHPKGKIVSYPDEVAEELVGTARRQQFVAVGWEPAGGPTAAQDGASSGAGSLAGPEGEGGPAAGKPAKGGKNKGGE